MYDKITEFILDYMRNAETDEQRLEAIKVLALVEIYKNTL